MTPARTSTPVAAPLPLAGEGATRPLIVLLDSHGIIFRSYFALRDVLTVRHTGEPIAAVFGYANTLLSVLTELHPAYVIAAWDASEQTFRKEKDERYKAHRESVPDDLIPQFGRVRSMLDAFRIPVVEKVGYEADDVLGTLAGQAHEQGLDVVIVTLDTDIVQLVQPGVRVWMYRPYQRDYVMYDTEAVLERWGFEPERMVDYKALTGDTSDNIPGVKGIGEKGAKALIAQYGTVDEMLAHIEEIEPKRMRTALEQGAADALHSYEMATIVRDVPGVSLDLDAALLRDYDRAGVEELFRELEFRSLIPRLPPGKLIAEPPGIEAALPEPAPAAALDGAYEMVTDAAGLSRVVAAVRASGSMAIEVIADAGHPMRAADTLVGIAISPAERVAFYIPFGHHASGQGMLLDGPIAPAQLDRAQVFEALVPLFSEPSIRRAGHDTKFAAIALAEADARLEIQNIDFDTQVAAYLLGDSNMSLARVAHTRLELDLPEPETVIGKGAKAIAFSAATVEATGAYAMANVDALQRSIGVLRTELERDHLDTVFGDIDLPHVPVLARMERFGVALDIEMLREMDRDLASRIASAERAVYDAVGHEVRIGSPLELSALLFEELSLPKTRKTKTGYTTDADALEPLRALHPVVDAILNWRELTKIKSTYVDTLPSQVNPRTGRVHSVFSQTTAATGRLSSNDPNLQNIPVRSEVGNLVRRAFVARDCGEDPVYLSIDYSQIELRVLAHIADDEALKAAFLAKKDIHRSTAALVFKKEESAVTSEDRRRAKVFNFGVLYGLTAFGMSVREGIPRDESESFIAGYFTAYPNVKEWRERTVEEARTKGYAETLAGRRRYIPELRSQNRVVRQAAERIAMNMPIQGTASDIIKIAMNRIDFELSARREKGAQARMILQVHDELIFELPRAELDEMREVAHRLMPSIELAVPLDLEEKVGTNWGALE